MDEKSSHNKLLTLDRLHEIDGYAGSTYGTQFIARFCNAIKHGETPSEEDLKFIAAALEPLKNYYQQEKDTTDNRLRDALDEFARLMKLKKKQGKGGSESLASTKRMAESVAHYIKIVRELVYSGLSESDAQKQALKWSSESEKIGTKAMKNRIKKYMEMAKILNSIP